MKTSEMIGEIKFKQMALSPSYGVKLVHDGDLIVVEDGQRGTGNFKCVRLTGVILSIEDWILSPTQISLLDALKAINTKDGVTFISTAKNIAYYFDSSNSHTPLDFLSFDDIISGIWFNGNISANELKIWNYINE